MIRAKPQRSLLREASPGVETEIARGATRFRRRGKREWRVKVSEGVWFLFTNRREEVLHLRRLFNPRLVLPPRLVYVPLTTSSSLPVSPVARTGLQAAPPLGPRTDRLLGRPLRVLGCEGTPARLGAGGWRRGPQSGKAGGGGFLGGSNCWIE